MDFRLTDGDQNFWWILFVYCRIQKFWHEKKWLCSWTNGSGFPMNTDDLSRYCSLGHPRWTLSQHRRPSLGFLPYCVSGPWWVTPFLWLFANGCSGGCAKSEKNPCQTSHAKQMATHSQRGKFNRRRYTYDDQMTHSVWTLPKKSHSIFWAKGATFTFWVEVVHFGELLKTWSLRSNSVTRKALPFNWPKKLVENAKLQMRHIMSNFQTFLGGRVVGQALNFPAGWWFVFLGFDIDPNHDTIGVSRKKHNVCLL